MTMMSIGTQCPMCSMQHWGTMLWWWWGRWWQQQQQWHSGVASSS